MKSYKQELQGTDIQQGEQSEDLISLLPSDQENRDTDRVMNLQSFPPEVLLNIVSWIEIKDRATLLVVSRELNRFLRDKFSLREFSRKEYFGNIFISLQQEQDQKQLPASEDESEFITELTKLDRAEAMLKKVGLANKENNRRLEVFLNVFCKKDNVYKDNKDALRKYFHGEKQDQFLELYPDFAVHFIECIIEFNCDLPFFEKNSTLIKLVTTQLALSSLENINKLNSDAEFIAAIFSKDHEALTRLINKEIDEFCKDCDDSKLITLLRYSVTLNSFHAYHEILKHVKEYNVKAHDDKKIDVHTLYIFSLIYALEHGNIFILGQIMKSDEFAIMDTDIQDFRIANNFLSFTAYKLLINQLNDYKDQFLHILTTSILEDVQLPVPYLQSVLPFLYGFYPKDVEGHSRQFIQTIGKDCIPNLIHDHLNFYNPELNIRASVKRASYKIGFLLENGFYINTCFFDNHTLLHLLMDKIKCKENLEQPIKDDATPLVKQILRYYPDVNIKRLNSPFVPLVLAIQHRRLDIVELLCDPIHKLDINVIAGNNDRRALDFAIMVATSKVAYQSNKSELSMKIIIRLLMIPNINLNIANGYGYTPFDLVEIQKKKLKLKDDERNKREQANPKKRGQSKVYNDHLIADEIGNELKKAKETQQQKQKEQEQQQQKEQQEQQREQLRQQRQQYLQEMMEVAIGENEVQSETHSTDPVLPQAFHSDHRFFPLVLPHTEFVEPLKMDSIAPQTTLEISKNKKRKKTETKGATNPSLFKKKRNNDPEESENSSMEIDEEEDAHDAHDAPGEKMINQLKK